MSGTDPLSGTENTAYCTDVCLGTTEYPDRLIQEPDGQPNYAGKVLRMSVDGGAAQPAPGPAFPQAPYVFGAGFRNPAGLTVHPLTGQLYVADRSDSLQAEIDLVAPGANGGWPCLEGSDISSGGVAGCLAGHTKDEVYANHPSWSHPIVAHTGNPQVTGLAVSTSLGYPEEFYGDVFYLLRDSARIYRIDLQPPCFMPTGPELTPLAFHDSNSDNDFRAVYDIDDDEDFDNVGLSTLSAIAQAPSPTGADVLYVAGKQGNGFTDDSVIYRIEFATTFTPYAGPAGRVPDSCFAGIENPFARQACLVPSGACAGQPDGTSCDDGDSCNGTDACQGGVCAHSGYAADGTSCTGTDGCRAGGACQSGACVGGVAVADGTPCPDADPCNGTESCQAGVCTSSGGPALFDVKSVVLRGGGLALTGNVAPAGPIAPSSTDAVALTIDAGGAPRFASTLAHPTSDPQWARSKPPVLFKYKDGSGAAGGMVLFQLKRRGSSYALKVKGRSDQLAAGAASARLVVGGQCYATSLTCTKKGKAVRCTP
jgi:glucose/sorbosone dehydrogenase